MGKLPTSAARHIRGQKRGYAYVPDSLEEEHAFEALSAADFAASQALSNISTIWDRHNHNVLHISFTAPDGTMYEARCEMYLARTVEDCDDPAIAREAISIMPELYPVEWHFRCIVARSGENDAMDDFDNCGAPGGRGVRIRDLRPALRAIFDAVEGASDRISSTHEPLNY